MSCLASGAMFPGAVTQSGTMVEGHYYYEAHQTCTLIVKEFDGRSLTCDIRRVERTKLINGSAAPVPSLPTYLRLYLTSRGSCVERATGTYDPLTSVLMLRGDEPVVEVESEVQWNPHLYLLMVDGGRVSGLVFDLKEECGDRVSGVGTMLVLNCPYP